MTVVPFPGRRRTLPGGVLALSPEHAAFCLARQAMARAWLEWLCIAPAEAAVTAESQATISLMAQMRAMTDMDRESGS